MNVKQVAGGGAFGLMVVSKDPRSWTLESCDAAVGVGISVSPQNGELLW